MCYFLLVLYITRIYANSPPNPISDFLNYYFKFVIALNVHFLAVFLFTCSLQSLYIVCTHLCIALSVLCRSHFLVPHDWSNMNACMLLVNLPSESMKTIEKQSQNLDILSNLEISAKKKLTWSLNCWANLVIGHQCTLSIPFLRRWRTVWSTSLSAFSICRSIWDLIIWTSTSSMHWCVHWQLM